MPRRMGRTRRSCSRGLDMPPSAHLNAMPDRAPRLSPAMSPSMTRPDGDAKTRVNGTTDSEPLLDVSPQVRADVDRRVAQELGVSVLEWSRMVGGAQNRLFRLDTLDGPPLLAKLYVVDRWPRLESEFATLRALNAQHLARVPQALLRDDGLSYAVYSFEPGEMRPAVELTRHNVEAIAAFTADLLRFG